MLKLTDGSGNTVHMVDYEFSDVSGALIAKFDKFYSHSVSQDIQEALMIYRKVLFLIFFDPTISTPRCLPKRDDNND